MQRFEAYPSATKLLGLMLLGILMVGIAVFFATFPDPTVRIAGWVGIVVFGFLMILNVRLALAIPYSRPKIVMDEAGIHTGASLGLIEWSDITALRIEAIRNTEFLSIYVVDKHKYLNRLPYLSRKIAEQNPVLGVSEIAISFVGLSPGLDEAWCFLREYGRDLISSPGGTLLEEWAQKKRRQSSS